MGCSCLVAPVGPRDPLWSAVPHPAFPRGSFLGRHSIQDPRQLLQGRTVRRAGPQCQPTIATIRNERPSPLQPAQSHQTLHEVSRTDRQHAPALLSRLGLRHTLAAPWNGPTQGTSPEICHEQ